MAGRKSYYVLTWPTHRNPSLASDVSTHTQCKYIHACTCMCTALMHACHEIAILTLIRVICDVFECIHSVRDTRISIEANDRV